MHGREISNDLEGNAMFLFLTIIVMLLNYITKT